VLNFNPYFALASRSTLPGPAVTRPNTARRVLMIRSALAVALVSLACLFSVAEDVVFRMEPPQPGRLAPFTVRADRRLSLPPDIAPGGTAVEIRTGDVLVPFLKPMDPADVRLLATLYEEDGDTPLARSPLTLFAATWALVFLWAYLLALPRGGYRRAASAPVLLTLLLLQMLVIKGLLLFTTLPIECLPLGLLPFLVVAMDQGRITAVGTVAAGVVLSGFAGNLAPELTTEWLLVGLTAVMAAPKRLKLGAATRAGVLTGLVQVIYLLLSGDAWRGLSTLLPPAGGISLEWLKTAAAHPAAVRSAWALGGALVAAGAAGVLLPFLSAGRNLGSTLTLRRYSDLDQPLLRRLFAEAPGTYQHSMNVAYLAQAAGTVIGANPLLLRIGAYYHDIGKVGRPEGFIENQVNGTNLHDRIDPFESIAIIHGHLIEGVRMAREARLPESVIQLVEQHHGTQVVEYFFQKARKLGARAPADEREFRYPGPKPRTIEAAVLMIADAVEAASRTVTTPGRATFDKLVRFIIVKRIADGQFGECVLDTRDLEAITRAMVDALEASFHARIRYPWQQAGAPDPDPAARRAG
jgi:putative nucleotidyltransferase with HDIG domain